MMQSRLPPPTLSIIVPTYNYADRLGKCLQSVRSQLAEEAELIVVDDGSTDATPTVLAQLHEGQSNFRHVRQANRGAAAARNHGLGLATGCFVLFLDADDELLPGTIAAITDHLGQHPETDLLIGGHISRRPDGREKTSRPSTFPESPRARIAAYLIHKQIDLGHGSFVARRELLERCPYPESLRKREDIPVFAYLLAYARIACIDHVMVRVHKHTNSLRHQVFDGDNNFMAFVAEVFRQLPANCQPLQRSYAALRAQSALRNALANRRWGEARHHLISSFHHDWRQVLRPQHVRKGLRALLAGRRHSVR